MISFGEQLVPAFSVTPCTRALLPYWLIILFRVLPCITTHSAGTGNRITALVGCEANGRDRK